MIVDRKVGNSTTYVVEERTEETRETPIVHISGKMGYSANCRSRLLKEFRLLSDYIKNSDWKD